MAEWLSYGLADFLLFSPRAYWRLFELQNERLWPLPLATLGAGIALIVLAWMRPTHRARWSAAILGLAWLWLAWSFFWRLYATINWAAPYVAPIFALEGALLFAAAWQAPPSAPPRRARTLLGLMLMTLAVLAYPLLAPLSGRPWMGAEIFGMAPDPTALATLGFALQLRGRAAMVLLPIPLLWGVASALTVVAMAAAPGG